MFDFEEVDHSLLREAHERNKVKLDWVQCYLAQTPPTFADCKAHFKKKGMNITEEDYKKVCKRMFKDPR